MTSQEEATSSAGVDTQVEADAQVRSRATTDGRMCKRRAKAKPVDTATAAFVNETAKPKHTAWKPGRKPKAKPIDAAAVYVVPDEVVMPSSMSVSDSSDVVSLGPEKEGSLETHLLTAAASHAEEEEQDTVRPEPGSMVKRHRED